MNESYFVKDTPIATRLTEAQSFAAESEKFAYVQFRYCTEEKTVELMLSTTFLKSPYKVVRNYLDDCIRFYLAKK